jgi:TPR repeat protein
MQQSAAKIAKTAAEKKVTQSAPPQSKPQSQPKPEDKIEPAAGAQAPSQKVTATQKNDVETQLTKEEEKSLAEVHFNIGMMFSNGDGVPQNSKLAAKWFTKSAEEGYPEAQYLLGEMYLSGQGVDKNSILAMEWLQKAADNNYQPAIELLSKQNQAGG